MVAAVPSQFTLTSNQFQHEHMSPYLGIGIDSGSDRGDDSVPKAGPTPSPRLAPTAAPTSLPARVLRDAVFS